MIVRIHLLTLSTVVFNAYREQHKQLFPYKKCATIIVGLHSLCYCNFFNNFQYKHLTTKIISSWSLSNATGDAIKSASIGATIREIRLSNIPHIFPMEKPINYRALKLTSWQIGGYTVSWMLATASWMLCTNASSFIIIFSLCELSSSFIRHEYKQIIICKGIVMYSNYYWNYLLIALVILRHNSLHTHMSCNWLSHSSPINSFYYLFMLRIEINIVWFFVKMPL